MNNRVVRKALVYAGAACMFLAGVSLGVGVCYKFLQPGWIVGFLGLMCIGAVLPFYAVQRK